MELEKRIAVEKKIVRRVFRKLGEIGFRVFQLEGDEDCQVKSNSDAYKIIFDLDLVGVYFRNGEGKEFWIRFVFGNDGWDVIDNYDVLPETEAVMDEMFEYCNKIQEEEG